MYSYYIRIFSYHVMYFFSCQFVFWCFIKIETFSFNSYNFKIFVSPCRVYFFVCVVSYFFSYFNYFCICIKFVFVSSSYHIQNYQIYPLPFYLFPPPLPFSLIHHRYHSPSFPLSSFPKSLVFIFLS